MWDQGTASVLFLKCPSCLQHLQCSSKRKRKEIWSIKECRRNHKNLTQRILPTTKLSAFEKRRLRGNSQMCCPTKRRPK